MPYIQVIRGEATDLANLGLTATEDEYHGLYTSILITWFPSMGYIIIPQFRLRGVGMPNFIITCQVGAHLTLLLIVELTGIQVEQYREAEGHGPTCTLYGGMVGSD